MVSDKVVIIIIIYYKILNYGVSAIPSAPWSAAIVGLLWFGIQSGEVFFAINIRCNIPSSRPWTSERGLIS